MTTVDRLRRIVAVGASAGGLAALEKFFRRIPSDTHFAFVVIQHLSPNFKSVMGELLTGFSQMPATVAEDGVVLEPNHIFVIPPGKDLEVFGLRLRVIERSPYQALHLPIDRFFSSLARHAGRQAVGVVLSGSGSDGSRGIIDIQRAGGRVFVQTTYSSAFDGMPKAAARAAPTAVIDSPEGIAEALATLSKSGPPSRGEIGEGPVEPWLPEDVGDLAPVFAAMIRRFDLDFSDYKSGTVARRLDRRLKARGCATVEAYAQLVEDDQSELDVLWHDLLIGVTRFFRDTEAFEVIERQVVPMLLEHASPDREIRVWVPGCASGEEAYSLAILFDEATHGRNDGQRYRIFATDVHRDALERASSGYFDSDALEGVSEDRLAHYFERRKDGFLVNPEIRRRVVFAEHNLLNDPPFTRMDLVSCRNLLIYLLPRAQAQVIRKFEFSIKPGGVLFLGPSESFVGFDDAFEPIHAGWKIFHKKSRDREVPSEEVEQARDRIGKLTSLSSKRLGPSSNQRPDPDLALAKVLGRYVPSGFLIDEQRTVLHIFGNAGDYLRVQGAVSLDLVSLVDTDLQLALTTTIHRALKEKRTAQVKTRRDSGETALLIGVDYVSAPDETPILLFVRLESTEPPATPVVPPDEELADIAVQRIQDLEQELVETSASLQSVVEELETSNEELQATNEELLASNEELQSTNEELQSVNEELHTVNAEHERKNDALVELATDQTLLMECTSIGMVFLGKGLEIRKFTPAIQSVFPLREQDIGRPLSDMTHRLAHSHQDLITRLREVLRTGELCEREVTTVEGTPMLERIHPHRGARGEMRGVAVSYVDISSIRRAEDAVRKSESLKRGVLDALAANIVVIDQEGAIVSVRGQWTEFQTGFAGEDPSAVTVGANYLAICLRSIDPSNGEDAHRALVGIQGVLSRRLQSFEHLYPSPGPNDEVRWYLMRVMPLDLKEGGAVIAHVEVTELERLRQDSVRTTKQLVRLGAAVSAAADGIVVCRADGAITYANPSFARTFGLPESSLIGKSLFDVCRDDAETLERRAWSTIVSGDRWKGEIDVGGLQLEITLSPIESVETGRVEQVVGVQRDVSSQRELERQLRHSQKMQAIGTLAGGIAHDFNNMLVAIMGYAYLLNEPLHDSPTGLQDLRQIEQAAGRARDLVDQILTFSRTVPGTVERIEPHRIVDECAALLRGSIPSSVEIIAKAERSGWLEADPTQLHQVVMNLATNAYQAIGDEGGTIEIVLTASDDGGRSATPYGCVVLTVKDDGLGIDDEVRDRLFEPFFTTKPDGTGMGLSVVHGIVNRLGGRIEVQSRLGEGSVFTVTLPAAEPPTNRVQPAYRVETPGSEHIVVVDDEPALAELIGRMLGLAGYVVETYTSGKAFLDRLDADGRTPDLLMLDHAMPRMTGLKLLGEVRRRDIYCPAVLVSGAAPVAESDFSAILKKPFTRDALVATVRQVIDDAVHKSAGRVEATVSSGAGTK